MLKDVSRNRLMGCWFAAVALIAASMIAMGVNVLNSTTALLLTMSMVPPAMMLLLWPGVRPATVAEVLYPSNTPNP